MNLNKLAISLGTLMLLFVSCSVDYNPGNTFAPEPDRLVINSYLNPQEPIDIHFYRTFKVDSGYGFRPLAGVKISLKENNKSLYNGICNDTILHLDHHPQMGATYTIEVSSDGLSSINASTTVPDSITCNMRANDTTKIVSLSHFKLSKQEQTTLWLTFYTTYNNKVVVQNRQLYIDNILVDNINQEEGGRMGAFGGSVYYDNFIRIKNLNLTKLDSILVSPMGDGIPDSYEDSIQNNSDLKVVLAQVKLITGSKEYDQYNRSLFQQKLMTTYDDDISAIVFQPIQVYSNINGGFGIFAGVCETNYYWTPYYEYP